MRRWSIQWGAILPAKQLAMAFGMLAVVSGCAVQPPLRVDVPGAKQPVALEKGQELFVSLQANRSTGYTWKLVTNKTPLLQEMGESTYAPANDGRLGAGGVETFHLQAIAKGTQKLRFLYRRPWKPAERPIDVQTLDIVVR